MFHKSCTHAPTTKQHVHTWRLQVSLNLNNNSIAYSENKLLLKPLCLCSGLPLDKDFPAMPPVQFNYTGPDLDEYELPSVGTKALMIDYGTNVEIVFQGTNIGNAENHPMHLHGYSFYLVGTGDGNWNADNITNYNKTYPPAVNTIGVPKNGWAAIRFKADNPGTLSLFSLSPSTIYIYKKYL
jgi:laccase